MAEPGELRPGIGGCYVGLGWGDKGPGGSDAWTQGQQGGDDRGGPRGPEESDKNRNPGEVAKDQKEVTRKRKGHKEETNNGEPRRPEGTRKKGALRREENGDEGGRASKGQGRGQLTNWWNFAR